LVNNTKPATFSD